MLFMSAAPVISVWSGYSPGGLGTEIPSEFQGRSPGRGPAGTKSARSGSSLHALFTYFDCTETIKI